MRICVADDVVGIMDFDAEYVVNICVKLLAATAMTMFLSFLHGICNVIMLLMTVIPLELCCMTPLACAC